MPAEETRIHRMEGNQNGITQRCYLPVHSAVFLPNFLPIHLLWGSMQICALFIAPLWILELAKIDILK